MAGRPPMAKMVEEDYMFSVILQHKGSRRLLPHGIGGMYSFAPIFFFRELAVQATSSLSGSHAIPVVWKTLRWPTT